MGVQDFIFTTMLKKVVMRVVQFGASWLIAHGLKDYGVSINVDVMTASALASLEGLRNYLKVSKGISWL